MTPMPSLDELDPARRDPGYWHRLHRRILDAAGPELARRRAMRDASVPVLVLEWSRAVVPTALLAATVAGLLLLRGGPEAGTREVATAGEERVEELIESRSGDLLEPIVGADGSRAGTAFVWFAEGGF